MLGQGADEFLGTQGDVWDTQWDMFLALVGATLSQVVDTGKVYLAFNKPAGVLSTMQDEEGRPDLSGYVGHLNDGGSLVDPGLWRGWLPAYFLVLAVLVLLEVWKLAAGRWSAPMLAAGLVADVALAVLLTAAVLTQQILDPRLLAGWSPPDWLPVAVVVAVWAVMVWDQAVTLRNYRSGGVRERT